MFTLRVRNPFGCHEVSCVKLPAAVAFPTDDRLLRRIEESRRALPQDNMKPLWKRREPLNIVSASVQRMHLVDARPAQAAAVAPAPRGRPTTPAESRSTFPQLVRIEELYLRNRVAIGL